MTPEESSIDWSLTTWKGSRREQLRRWSELTWDEILQAQEEMAELANELNPSGRRLAPAPFESHIVVGDHAQALGAREDVLAGLDAVPIVGAGTRFVDGTEPGLIAG